MRLWETFTSRLIYHGFVSLGLTPCTVSFQHISDDYISVSDSHLCWGETGKWWRRWKLCSLTSFMSFGFSIHLKNTPIPAFPIKVKEQDNVLLMSIYLHILTQIPLFPAFSFPLWPTFSSMYLLLFSSISFLFSFFSHWNPSPPLSHRSSPCSLSFLFI